MSGNAVRFRQPSVSRQAGERARLKVVQGPDYGSVFVITGMSVRVGRGEDNDVVLTDLKASRFHLTIQLTPQGWVAQDAGSANGILINQTVTRQSRMQSGDTLRLGETLLEFVVAEVGTMILTAPPKSPDQLRAEQQAMEAQRQRVRALGNIGIPARGASEGGNSLQRLAVLGGAVLAFYFLVLSPAQVAPKKSTKASADANVSKTEPRELASLMSNELSLENRKTMETFFKAGFREYREGNFLRARAQFDTILQMDPTHPLARLYSANCDAEIDRMVRNHKEAGARSLVLGRKRDARSQFESVLRLRSRDQSHPEYKEAVEQIQKIDREGGA
jgi:pSer/pThr/pTyr-binding forkhead associated (FHA) protein